MSHKLDARSGQADVGSAGSETVGSAGSRGLTWYARNADYVKTKAKGYYREHADEIKAKRKASRGLESPQDRERRLKARRERSRADTARGRELRGLAHDLYVTELKSGVSDVLLKALQGKRAKRHEYYKRNQARLRKLAVEKYWKEK